MEPHGRLAEGSRRLLEGRVRWLPTVTTSRNGLTRHYLWLWPIVGRFNTGVNAYKNLYNRNGVDRVREEDA